MATTEERLAALETKLAQLTATTPTTYYTHQYSGEEIDAAVGRAVTGGALDTSVGNVSRELGTFVRPNLLDNWYFGRPVNQRGQTEYSGDGYTIDRWVRRSGSGNLFLTADGLKFTSAGGTPDIILDQQTELKLPKNSKATLSMLVSEFNATSGRVELQSMDKTVYIKAPGLYTITGDASYFDDQNKKSARIYTANIPSGGSATVLAAKLELGPTQTLAHREGDKWVLNEIPDYGEQLRRCQRYCRVYKAGTTLPCLAYPQMDGGWYASAGLPTNGMRTIPINNIGDGKKIAIVDLNSDDATHDDMNMTNWGQNGNMLCLRISGGSHGVLMSKFPYYIKLKEDLILSADL